MKKIAVVTGASSGMGREAAVQLADQFGWLDEIWLIARREERLLRLRKELPCPSRIFELDLTKQTALSALSSALEEEQPRIVFLVNAAGYGKIGRVGEVSLSEEMGMPDLNCAALTGVTHLALPYMGANSRILQFASSAAFLPQPGFAVYAATKAFVLSYSRALGEEVKKRGIYVTAVCPGPVKTEFFDIAQTTGSIPLYKVLAMADPKKVVRLAIRDSVMKKSVSVYGPLMKLFRLASKALPHSFLLSLMSVLSPEQAVQESGNTQVHPINKYAGEQTHETN